MVTYYLADHLGSVVQESSAAGAITLEREYDPWGVAIQGASTSGYAFTGREWDAETQLHYYRARYYSPEHGRFMSDDPSGLSAGINLLEYVGNSPAGRIDPFGLQWYRPPNEDPQFGRDGTPITPEGLGKIIADWVPAAHAFSKIHDELLGRKKSEFKTMFGLSDDVADLMLNFPSMPVAGNRAIETELKRSMKELSDFLRNGWPNHERNGGKHVSMSSDAIDRRSGLNLRGWLRPWFWRIATALVTVVALLGCTGNRRDISHLAPYSEKIGHTYKVVGAVEALGIELATDGQDGPAYIMLARSEPPYKGSEIAFRRPVKTGESFRVIAAEVLDTVLDDTYYYVVEFDRPIEPELRIHLNLRRFDSESGDLNPEYFERVK